MDSEVFLRFCENFVSETKVLRDRHRNIILKMDGYAAHTSYKALSLQRENRIHVVALPAHTSHQTQTLDSLFSPLKTYLRNALNDRSLISTAQIRNDIHTLCEVLQSAYRKSVTYTNNVNRFKGCGVWCAVRKGAILKVMRFGEITNCEAYESREEAF